MSLLYVGEFYYFSTRHGLTLVIPCLFFAGHGLIFAVESLSRGMNRVVSKWSFLKKYLFHILTSILVLIFVVQALSIGRTDKINIKRMGLWLKERGYQGSVIMGTVRFYRLAFYADGKFFEMPDSWEKVVESIHRNRVRVIVIDSCTIEQDCPGFLPNFSQVGLFPLQGSSGKGEGCLVKIFGVY